MSNQDVVTMTPLIGQGDDVRAGVLPRSVESGAHPRHWSFRVKMALLALALGLAPAFLVVALLSWQSDRLTTTAQSTAVDARAAAAAGLVGTLLSTDSQVIQGIAATEPATLLVTQPGSAQQIQQYRLAPLFDAARGTVPSLAAGTLYVTTPGGTILAATRSTLLDSPAGGVLPVQEAVTARAPAAVLGAALGTGQPALIVAAPILRGSTVVGAVVGEFAPKGLFDTLASLGGVLVLADGRTLTGPVPPAGPPAQILGSALTPAAPRAGSPAALDDGSRAVPVLANAPLVLRVSPVHVTTSLLASGAVLPLLVLVLLLTGAAALFSVARLTRPLSRLARALASVRKGNYGTRVGLRQRDEIGQIAETVDMLIARTQTLVTDLDNQRLELENGIIQLFTELAEAASGDLTVRPTMSEGSLGAVADSVGILLERFNATVKRIQATAGAVSSGTSQVAATVLRVSQEAQKQAAQLASGAAAITEMAVSAQSVSQRTFAATDVAAQAVVAVESGNTAVNYARDAVKRTSETSKRAARQVKSLGESAQLMGNALLLVQRNTEELHLIAGNASIEAARYAENGGVFRTVADSIEQLAQQSQVALRQIQSVVENTQRETSRVVGAIEEVTGEVSNVARAVSLAGENFDTINVVVQRLADLNMFIASASEQQARMAADVAEVIGNLNQISVQTSMNTAASAEAAVQLRQLTEQLNDSVSTLKVS